MIPSPIAQKPQSGPQPGPQPGLQPGPQPGPQSGPSLQHSQSAAALDLIFIEGLRGNTVIGIHETELHRPQPLLIDLVAGLPRARACSTDRINDTIDYSVVRERLHKLLAEHKLQLLEAFAEAVADILLSEFGAHWVRIKVAKPHKFDDLQAVGVQIERWAAPGVGSGVGAGAEPTPQQHARGAAVLQLIGHGMVPGSR